MASFTPKHETVLGRKLAGMLDRIQTRPNKEKRGGSHREPRPSPTSWVEDGVDHINIWDDASTALGKALAHGVALPFNHEVFGRFNTMEAFWYFISSREHDDRLRTMRGKAVYDFSKKLTKLQVPNFSAIIIEANWQKINQYPDLKAALIESTLPFDVYYRANRGKGLPIRPPFSNWLVDGFTEIRAALQEGRELNLKPFRDKDDRSNEPVTARLLEMMTKNQSTAARAPATIVQDGEDPSLQSLARPAPAPGIEPDAPVEPQRVMPLESPEDLVAAPQEVDDDHVGGEDNACQNCDNCDCTSSEPETAPMVA